jgi:hypothetical protein
MGGQPGADYLCAATDLEFPGETHRARSGMEATTEIEPGYTVLRSPP